MAFFKRFSAAQPPTTNNIAEALDPSVTAIHPKNDRTPEELKADGPTGPTASEYSLDEKNPFSDPKVADFYKNVYETSQYECRSAFDPDLEWTPAEEKRLVRKLDMRVCAFACFAFFALQVDRGNLAQAVADNLLVDLDLTTDDFNTGEMGKSTRGRTSADTSRQYHLQSVVPAGGDPFSAYLQEAWTGPMDSQLVRPQLCLLTRFC